jgi:hypothetical protein
MNVFSFRKPLFRGIATVTLFFLFVLWRAMYVSEKDQKSYDSQAREQLAKHVARKKGIEKELPRQTRWDVTKRMWLSDKNPRHEIELHGSRSEIDIFMRKSEARLIETFYDVQGITQQELFYKAADGKEYVYDATGKLRRRGSVDKGTKKQDTDTLAIGQFAMGPPIGSIIDAERALTEEVMQTEDLELQQETQDTSTLTVTELKEGAQAAAPEVENVDMSQLEPMQSFRYFEAERTVYDYYTHSLIAYDVNFWTYTSKGHSLVRNFDGLWPESSGSASSMTMCHEGSLSSAQMSAENLSMQVTPEW